MNFRFTISRKLGFGFGVLIFLSLVVFILTQITLSSSRTINEKIISEITPARLKTDSLYRMIYHSELLINNWVYNTSVEFTHKDELRALIDHDYHVLKRNIIEISKTWNDSDKMQMNKSFRDIENLFGKYKRIMQTLNSFDKYSDPSAYLLATDVLEFEIRSLCGDIQAELLTLIEKLNLQHENLIDEIHRSFSNLQIIVLTSGILMVIGGILIAYFTGRSIVVPIYQLRKVILLMARGILPKKDIQMRRDEIGEMGDALNVLSNSIKQKEKFSTEVGKGNFDAEYNPLSKFDDLGLALLMMRDSLRESELLLEKKVAERTREVEVQKEELEAQRHKMENLYLDVTDSIRYARHIQYALLPSADFIKNNLPNSFVFYKPKAIVCGDFYWIHKIGKFKFFAAVDCTGHGVPGAFMSILGHNLIEEVVKEYGTSKDAAFMLTELNRLLTIRLKQKEELSKTRDGMDMAFCILNEEELKLNYAGAFNPLYILRNNELIEFKGDPYPVGIFLDDTLHQYTNHEIEVQPRDMIYAFTDGYTDQFGGPHDKKFKRKKFKELLASISKLELSQQRNVVESTFETWKGVNNEQTDDVLVMGIRV